MLGLTHNGESPWMSAPLSLARSFLTWFQGGGGGRDVVGVEVVGVEVACVEVVGAEMVGDGVVCVKVM